MSNVTVQEALKAAETFIGDLPFSLQRDIELRRLHEALADIEKCEPVGITENLFEDNDVWLSKLPVGTKLFTSPHPREWADVPYEERRDLYKSLSKGNIDGFADLLSARLKQLNTKG